MRQSYLLLVLVGGCAGASRTGNPDFAVLPDLTVVYDFTVPKPSDGGADLVTAPDLAADGDMVLLVDMAMPDAACGNNMGCITPPPPTCEANVIRTYSMQGMCVQAMCNYPSMTMTCMYGCYQAQCTAKLSFLGNTAAFTTNGPQIMLVKTNSGMGPNGTPATKTVSVTTQTFPHGAVKSAHLVYATDPNFTMNKTDLTMSFDKLAGNNDQWFAVIPAFPANTQIYLYVAAFSYTGNPNDDLYDPGNFVNYTYIYN